MHGEQMKEWCPRYRMPVLKTSEKGWRVEFYYNKNGCFTRKQIRVEKYRKQFPNNDNARMWIQENIMYPLSEELRKGWTPEQGLPRLVAGTITLKKLLDEFGDDKRQKFGADILRTKSIGTYKTHISVAEQSMLAECGSLIADCDISEITVQQAERYIIGVKCLRDWSVTTANNYLKFMRMVFKFASDNGYISSNPFEKVKLLRGETEGKRPLTKEEMTTVYNHLKEKEDDLPFLIFTQLVYTDLLRPIEIFRLQKKDFDRSTMKFTVSGEKSKNKKTRIAYIPQALQDLFTKYLEKVGFDNLDRNMYLFHENFLPSKPSKWKKVIPIGSDYSSRRWAELRKELNLPDDCKLYGLRHTGISDLLDILPANTVRMHADHSDLRQTIHYADHENEQIRKEVAAKAPIYGKYNE